MKKKYHYKEEWKVKDKIRANQWYKDNREKHKEYMKNRPIESLLLNAAKTRANKLGLEFNLELSDIVIPETCPIMNTLFIRGTHQAASLDRVDPMKGYIKGNVQVISRIANTIKNCGTAEQHRKIADYMETFINHPI
jgi:hypothetical protein